MERERGIHPNLKPPPSRESKIISFEY